MKRDIFICFLRGINVSGKNMIRMKDLTALFSKLGFSDINTYLQSGNIVFRSGEMVSGSMLAKRIRQAITEESGLDIPVLVKSEKELNEIFTANPFLNDKQFEPDKLHVTMLDSVPGKEKTEEFIKGDYSPERFEIRGADIFLYCPEGYGRAKLNNNFIERKLGVTATTRNWKTITSLREIVINL